MNAERSRATVILICIGDQFAQAVQSFQDFFLRCCHRGWQIRCYAVFDELSFNFAKGGVAGLHGISARAAVYVDIDKSGSQYQVRKIQNVACGSFRIVARPQSNDLPIFYNHYRRFNPFDGVTRRAAVMIVGMSRCQSCLHVLWDCCNHKTPRKAPGSPLPIEMVEGKNLAPLKSCLSCFPFWNS